MTNKTYLKYIIFQIKLIISQLNINKNKSISNYSIYENKQKI